MEETRDECIKAVLNYLQGLTRGYLGRMEYKGLIHKTNMIPVMQRNMRKYLYFRDWTWFSLINGTKTFIGLIDVELKSIESQLNTIYTEYERMEKELADRRKESGEADMI